MTAEFLGVGRTWPLGHVKMKLAPSVINYNALQLQLLSVCGWTICFCVSCLSVIPSVINGFIIVFKPSQRLGRFSNALFTRATSLYNIYFIKSIGGKPSKQP